MNKCLDNAMEPESFETMKCLGFLELVRLYCTAYFLLVSTKIIKLHLSKYTIIYMQVNELEILSQKPAKISTILISGINLLLMTCLSVHTSRKFAVCNLMIQLSN